MANPFKTGFGWYPFDVTFFKNKKVRMVRGRYGSDGTEFLVYLYNLIHDDGFYSVIDDDFYYIAADDLGHSYEKIGQMLNFFLGRSLFDDKLFKTDKVLTSRRIQKQFQDLVKSRKQVVEVESKLWLLSEDETKGCIKVTSKDGYSEKNNQNSEKNNQNSEKTDTEYSRVENNIVEDIKRESKNSVSLAPEEYNSLVSEFGEDKVKHYINHFTEYCNEKNKWKDYPNPAVTIRRWIVQDIEKDKLKPKKSGKFNNYTDTNGIDFKAFEEQTLNEMMEG